MRILAEGALDFILLKHDFEKDEGIGRGDLARVSNLTETIINVDYAQTRSPVNQKRFS